MWSSSPTLSTLTHSLTPRPCPECHLGHSNPDVCQEHQGPSCQDCKEEEAVSKLRLGSLSHCSGLYTCVSLLLLLPSLLCDMLGVTLVLCVYMCELAIPLHLECVMGVLGVWGLSFAAERMACGHPASKAHWLRMSRLLRHSRVCLVCWDLDEHAAQPACACDHVLESSEFRGGSTVNATV